MKLTRIRAGLYETENRKYRIERLDQHVDDGDDYYDQNALVGQWRVSEQGLYSDEHWLTHFNSLRAAKEALEND